MFRKSLSISKQVPVFADDSEEHLIEVGMRRSERAQAAQEDPYRAHWAPHTFPNFDLATLNNLTAYNFYNFRPQLFPKLYAKQAQPAKDMIA